MCGICDERARQDEEEFKASFVTIPVISLWMPWANWIMLEWKKIETRTHRRFAGLAGKRIGIHASQKWDDSAIQRALPYLTGEQIDKTQNFLRIGGAIIGTIYVPKFGPLSPEHAWAALIECETKRYGLWLEKPQIIPAIPMRGKQGIWYADIPKTPS